MTLRQVIRTIEQVASKQPAVNMIVRNDIFRLSAKSDARYGVFGWTQGQHEGGIYNNMFTFNFTFFYIDRLTSDMANQVEVQSVGIQVLDNIIKTLNEKGVYSSGTYRFTTFNQRFLDECAGVFCNITLQVLASSSCADDLEPGDYNNDFNEDFLIY